MREIKFRAWLPINYLTKGNKLIKESVMVYGDNLKFSMSEEFGDAIIVQYMNIVGSKKVCANVNFESDKAILMQFTGLKDKNNKEIFEGDIVKRIDFDVWENKNSISIVEVIWNEDGGFGFSTIRSDWPYGFNKGEVFTVHPFKSSEFEVIGNKFENTELLR